MASSLPNAVHAILDCFSECPEVAAISLGGSRSTDLADTRSDYDIYVHVDAEIPADVRRELASRFDPAPEIGNTWFGSEDAWQDRSGGVAIDLVYCGRGWFEEQLRNVIERHRSSLGYSTAFWYTARNSAPLFDRDGWFASMRELARTPYPEPLRRAIVAFNQPLLRTAQASWRRQIELAIGRDDPVSVQHRVTALLASVFDILFAVHRELHPGEKRLLDHLARLMPDVARRFDPLVRDILGAPPHPTERGLLAAIDTLCDAVDETFRNTSL